MADLENDSKTASKHGALAIFGVVLAALIIYVLIFRNGADEDALADLEGRANQAYAAGDYKEAETLTKKYREKIEDVYGILHPNVASALNNLALIYKAQNRHEEAVILFQRALKINQTTLGLNHPAVVASMLNLSMQFESMGNLKDAVLQQQKALEITESALGPDHPNVLTMKDELTQLREKIEASE